MTEVMNIKEYTCVGESHAPKAIVVGRHAPIGLPYNVVEQLNITFSSDLNTVVGQVDELFEAAAEKGAILLFQSVPGILACALTHIAMRNVPTHLNGVGVVVSKPDERPSGNVIDASHSVFSDTLSKENIEHYLGHVIGQANPNVKFIDGHFVVDPPMKFVFEKIEWLFV